MQAHESKPKFQLPTNPVAVAVALADKLDTLVGFWAIDEKPTGSKDPYALRRAALGVVRIILENDVRLDLRTLLQIGIFKELSKDISKKQHSELDGVTNVINKVAADNNYTVKEKKNFLDLADKLFESAKAEISKSIGDCLAPMMRKSYDLLTFTLDRLKVYLRDQGIRHDIIDAVFANGEDDLVAIVNRVKALQAFITTPEGENLLAGYKRAANILKAEAKKGDLPEGMPSRPDEPYGAAVFDALQIASTEIDAALAGENYQAAMQSLAKLRSPVDVFFTEVQVISDDTAVKENNLRLLGLIRDTAQKIADFEAIQG